MSQSDYLALTSNLLKVHILSIYYHMFFSLLFCFVFVLLGCVFVFQCSKGIHLQLRIVVMFLRIALAC